MFANPRLCATHYHELAEIEQLHAGVKNYHVAVRETPDGIAFLRVVQPGSTNRSYGIQVARLAGLPTVVIQRAAHVLEQLTHQGTLPSRGTRRHVPRPMREESQQLALFGAVPHPVLGQLQRMDRARMTPLEALTALHRFQERLRDEPGTSPEAARPPGIP